MFCQVSTRNIKSKLCEVIKVLTIKDLFVIDLTFHRPQFKKDSLGEVLGTVFKIIELDGLLISLVLLILGLCVILTGII